MEDSPRLKNVHTNGSGEREGTAFFPYFNREITVICREGVTSEYAEKCLEYLEEVDETLILQICKYAEFYLKDILENTSIGELYYGEGEPFPHDGLLGMLQYFRFEILYIEEPPAAPGSDNVRALNLYGGCDWQEDEGIQCLVKDGEVIFLGGFGMLSVWRDHSRDHIGNYVLYEKRDELRREAAEKRKKEDGWKIGSFAYWKTKGLYPALHKLEFFTAYLSTKENLTPKDVTGLLEDTYLYGLMQEYPELMEESIEFWYECYRIEKASGEGALVEHICENCQWDMF
ncbi:MAG: hypothetical protein NC420_02835 [Eubacterium sp.]|nr:hypothetical protein [Eubacterium sp.]